MNSRSDSEVVGVLLSGGLDSSILVWHLLHQGRRVRPFYVRSQLVWEEPEVAASRRFLAALSSPRLRGLVTLEMPLTDVYGGHWSVTGEQTPDACSDDAAVYLPGRNALLVIKAAIWCQMNGIEQLALAPLETNPFADATSAFFDHFQAALNHGAARPLRILRPFQRMSKREVMQLGCECPLHLTFSCISPHGGLHCGRCNKCAERQAAFRSADLPDPTRYVRVAAALPT